MQGYARVCRGRAGNDGCVWLASYPRAEKATGRYFLLLGDTPRALSGRLITAWL